jgi:hypothetical protein
MHAASHTLPFQIGPPCGFTMMRPSNSQDNNKCRLNVESLRTIAFVCVFLRALSRCRSSWRWLDDVLFHSFHNRTVNDECTSCVSDETRGGMWHSRGDRCSVQQKDQQKRAILRGNERAMPVCTDAEFEQNVHAKGCSTRTGASRRPRASSIPTSCVPASFIRDAGTQGPTRCRVRDYPNVGS